MDPTMVVTIALVVFLSSIIVFFAHEFGEFFKKIFTIPGIKLFLPLVLASWFVRLYEDWILWLFLWFQALLNHGLNQLVLMLPIEYSYFIVRISFLFIISCLPLWIFAIKAKYKKIRTPISMVIYWFSIISWLIGALLLVIGA